MAADGRPGAAATHFATRARGAEVARQRRHEAAAEAEGAGRNEDTGRLIEEALARLPAREREAFVTEHRGAIDLAFSLEQDSWNGERYLQLSVADFRAPE